MTDQELSYHICLLLIPHIGNITFKTLISYCGSPEAVLRSTKTQLLKIPNIGEGLASSITAHHAHLERAVEEIDFIHRNQIQVLSYLSPQYPKLLSECGADSPALLYYKGNASLDAPRMIAMVGTRNISEYGKERCAQLVEELKKYNATVVSGLAYGVDYHAHTACLQHQIPTIGVLGHGLDRIYPPTHRDLAKRMLNCGGLLSEFTSKARLGAENFPRRNRIIAGLTQATIVVETADQGGSIITARAAASYSREVFAVPGRVGDPMSVGCNWLIKKNTAMMLESVADLAEFYGWEKNNTAQPQTQLPFDLNKQEASLLGFLNEKRHAHIDLICYYTQLEHGTALANLLTLEFKGWVQAMPGSIYKILADYR